MTFVENLEQAVLVVAHPDDEILWFSGIFPFVGRVLVCYLETPGDERCTAAREQVVARFPEKKVDFLRLTESMSFGRANWEDPEPTPWGLWLGDKHGRVPVHPGFNAGRYRSNHVLLVDTLRPRLQGAPVVVTHNPWGEYGHEEHVQVHRAIKVLQAELGFEMWFDTYASDRSATLMARSVARVQYEHVTLPTQRPAVQAIENLYRETGCWTWPYEDYSGFSYETYAREPRALPPHRQPGSLLPINYLTVDSGSRQDPRRSIVRRIRRRLSRFLNPV